MMTGKSIRIAKRRGQYASVEDFLRMKRRAERYPDLRVREGSGTISPMTHGGYRTPAAPTLEDYDHGISKKGSQ